ncbi:Methyltransferase domain-containing protein [Filimonas lacunae]|uniref:Methyltransferase domain-containing protein n=1 Tax=Filimonas lacunae TaxID=477680 RepID=A0A173MD93_9BACT|nr:class I SAM-dependent methyltransferase [Filimonas lacunae]BAV05562.1 SAM-dependent methyltransferases [Filimonas lacunae]SIT29364.1 Methyltransferase domain-containing protein [Filimonas lacunae]
MQQTIHKTPAQHAFNKQSAIFDHIYTPNLIIQYKRQAVRDHMAAYLAPHSHILELNAGTGEDATYFAQQGHSVHATDIAEDMQQVLREKVQARGLTHQVSQEICSYTSLNNLQQQGPYDAIFSNFAGLNCTGQLHQVLSSFSPLLKPGGLVTLVIMPRFCLWEVLLLLKGKWRTAFRRFKGKNGVPARVEGIDFTCWYYPPRFIQGCLQEEFELLQTEGLCTIVPPSYLNTFPVKYPRLYQQLIKWEKRYKHTWPWRLIGDYYIISLRKK